MTIEIIINLSAFYYCIIENNNKKARAKKSMHLPYKFWRKCGFTEIESGLGSSAVIEQKQPPEVFCEKRCFWKFHKIYRKTSVPKSLF